MERAKLVSEEYGTFSITVCQGCGALMAGHREVCGRCLVEGEPQQERERRLSTMTYTALVFFIHFPVMTAFRVALYSYLRVPVWLWIFYVVETMIWLFVTIAGLLSVGKIGNKKREIKKNEH